MEQLLQVREEEPTLRGQECVCFKTKRELLVFHFSLQWLHAEKDAVLEMLNRRYQVTVRKNYR